MRDADDYFDEYHDYDDDQGNYKDEYDHEAGQDYLVLSLLFLYINNPFFYT